MFSCGSTRFPYPHMQFTSQTSMNKLRKAPPPPLTLAPKIQHGSPSRTMMFAQTTTITSSPSPSIKPIRSDPLTYSTASPTSLPLGDTNAIRHIQPAAGNREQYWAARALTAETLLSTNVMYQEQLRMMTEVGEAKHSQEIADIKHHHELRNSKLERFAMLLMTWSLALVAVLVYLLVRGHPPQVASRWVPPLHFTIPVLSPFTSVTEHEMSTLSTRTVVIMILASSCLAYGCFTYWLRQQKR